MAILDVRNLSFTYPECEKKAIDNVSFTLSSGEIMTVVGATGSGKSTLLRLLKPELRQNGTAEGEILLCGANTDKLTPAVSAAKIGYVAQNPEEQIVTDRVWHELAFTLENLGAPQSEIARRTAEIAAFFGIEPWYHMNTAQLSGGQKQLLNLAAVMTSDPELLILDEPTAQLDPVSAARFIEAVRKLNEETGLTVIITEHRADELIPISDRLLILDSGRATFCDSPKELTRSLTCGSPYLPYLPYLPAAAKIFAMTGCEGECPLSVREGQRYLSNFNSDITALGGDIREVSAEIALEMKQVFFRYDRHGADVLKGLDLKLFKGEVFALLGGNGAGKSTAVAVAAGLRKPVSGKVKLFGKPLREYSAGSLYRGCVSLLPQDVESMFLYPTVREELKGCEKALSLLNRDLSRLYDRHPYDLSGGERQLIALCKALSTDPRLLILDEPSKGLDPAAKAELAELIRNISLNGVTVLAVSHDIDFAAECADRCALLFDGAIAACESTGGFLSRNRFYTTHAARISRPMYEDGYTCERAAMLALKNGRRR